MIDSFVLLTPLLMLGVVAVLAFVGCDRVFGLDRPEPTTPVLNAEAGDGRVDLTWDVNPNAYEFHVKRSETSGIYGDEPLAVVQNGIYKYPDFDVTNGVPYYYVVTAIGEEGETEPSNEEPATPGVAASTEFLKMDMAGTPANAAGTFGVAIQVGASNLKIKELGRIFLPNNNGDHIMRVFKVIDAATVMQVGNAVVVSMMGGSPGVFQYTAVPDPGIILEAGVEYYIVSQEMNPGDQFYNHNTTVELTESAALTGAGTVTGAARQNGATYIRDADGQVSYGIVNLKYQLQ